MPSEKQTLMNSGLDNDHLEEIIRPLRDLAVAEGLWRVVEHPRGTELMAQGAAAEHIFVLDQGLVKLTYATAEGGERVKSFIVDKGVFGAAIGDDEIRYAAVTLETSVVCALPVRWLTERLASHPALATALARFDRWFGKRKEARELSLLCDTAEDRFRALLRAEPQLVLRLPQADIARYIGVTPIAFSRIKRRMNAAR